MKNLVLIIVFITVGNLLSQNIDKNVINVNNITFPIQNDGDNGAPGIRYDSLFVGYSMGFYLTGYESDSLWSNGMFHSNFVLDYLPGNIGGDENSELNKFYMLSAEENDFDSTWLNWKTAVEQGAYFYDGNNDGVYDPIDLNENGIWDENEDRPDLIGDITAWSVFNDGKSSDERKFNDVAPKGIEIAQTIFAYSLEDGNVLNNVVFVRYVISNKGTVTDNLDSVYFSLTLDPDIGDYWNDLTGSDLELNSTFAFNKDDDDVFGANAPAIYSTLLQGPIIQSEGSSIGVNRRGPYLGETEFDNSSNMKMTSSVSPRRKSILIPIRFGDPENSVEARNLSKGGIYHNGDAISVNNFELGNGSLLGSSADTIDANYMFSGNPIDNTGWLSAYESDWRTMNSTGPFELTVDKPIEMIYALVVGRGDSPLTSLALTKQYATEVIKFYESNFTKVPTSVKNTKTSQNYDFELLQNYPNPFNPTTQLSYQLPESGFVNLTVYNIIGQEVAVLVNREQSAGSYEVKFDGSGLTSGVYFYRLHASTSSADNFVQVNKMLLLR